MSNDRRSDGLYAHTLEGEHLMETEQAKETVIRQLEERLLQPEVRRSASDVAALLADDFREFGSSGRSWTKQQIIETLQHEAPMQGELSDFHTTTLAQGIVLATYTAVRHVEPVGQPVSSLRSSIWRWSEGRWQMLFHQGTPSKWD